jgi:hypothetical protein
MIKLRGYEPKYTHPNDEPGIISGGKMWENNNELSFVEPITGNTSSIHHTPFEYKDLMLGSPYTLNGVTIYEEDIIKFMNTGTIGVVKQDEHMGWVIISAVRGHKYSLVDSIPENITIISNTFAEADGFTVDKYDTAIENAVNDFQLIIEDIEKDDKFVGSVHNETLDSLYAIDFVFETKKRANKWLNKINKSHSNVSVLFRDISVVEKVLVLS